MLQRNWKACIKLCVSVLILTTILSSFPACNCGQPEGYYQLLGVPRDASLKDIKKAFRKLAIQYHPDKNPDPDARVKFEKIANAYDVLSSPKKKRHYDQFGDSSPDQQGSTFDFDTFFGRGSPHAGEGGGDGFFNFDDLFKDNFFEFDFGHPSNHGDDDYFTFSPDGGGGFESPFDHDMFGGFSESFQQSAGQSCETVTTRTGNTVTTYTRCT